MLGEARLKFCPSCSKKSTLLYPDSSSNNGVPALLPSTWAQQLQSQNLRVCPCTPLTHPPILSILRWGWGSAPGSRSKPCTHIKYSNSGRKKNQRYRPAGIRQNGKARATASSLLHCSTELCQPPRCSCFVALLLQKEQAAPSIAGKGTLKVRISKKITLSGI